jgi:hypothetical protein
MSTVAVTLSVVKPGRDATPATTTTGQPAGTAAAAAAPAVTGRIVTGCGLADLFHEAVVLTIHKPDGTEQLYWLGCATDAGRIVGLTLRKFRTGQLYHVVYDPEDGCFVCDCPDSTYRERACKHLVALHDALTHPAE